MEVNQHINLSGSCWMVSLKIKLLRCDFYRGNHHPSIRTDEADQTAHSCPLHPPDTCARLRHASGADRFHCSLCVNFHQGCCESRYVSWPRPTSSRGGDLVLHSVSWLVQGDDDHVAAAHTSPDRHLEGEQTVVSVGSFIFHIYCHVLRHL